MYLVLIETSGNQRFIFDTNKLRENVGASELTYRAGTRFVLDAVAQVTEQTPAAAIPSMANLAHDLRDHQKNPPIAGNAGRGVEIVTAVSGKALLLVDTEARGKEIVRIVTRRALEEAPGLSVHGAIVPVASQAGDPLHGIADAVREVHGKVQRHRYGTPRPQQRFPRLSLVAPCATSGLPAREFRTLHGEEGAWSAVTIGKTKAAEGGMKRIQATIQRDFSEVHLAGSVGELERRFEDLRWIAVVHADGNGLGEIFQNFRDYAACTGGRDYIDKYRRFSLALDRCTTLAFARALQALKDRIDRTENPPALLPVVPLILGGDDVTFLCDGAYALRFTHDFLEYFEEESNSSRHFGGIVPDVAERAFGVPRLGICAGIAIVKPHFPFHGAYRLAEALLSSAKEVKIRVRHEHDGQQKTLPASALDYHVLYDTQADSDRIRARLRIGGAEETRLYVRPYIVTERDRLQGVLDPSWVDGRRWEELERRVEAMRQRNKEGRRTLPNSMLHELRTGLFLGRKEADARMRLMRHRYSADSFKALLIEDGGEESLFQKTTMGNATCYETHFLDALSVVEFWA